MALAYSCCFCDLPASYKGCFGFYNMLIKYFPGFMWIGGEILLEQYWWNFKKSISFLARRFNQSQIRLYSASPGLVVTIWCSHRCGPGSVPGQGVTPPVAGCHTVVAVCCRDAESYATSISNTSRFQWNFQTKTDWKEGLGHPLPKKLAMQTLWIAVEQCLVSCLKVWKGGAKKT